MFASLQSFVANPLLWFSDLAQAFNLAIGQPLSWGHPAALFAYLYIVLGLGGGVTCLVLRGIVQEKQAEFDADRPELQTMIDETHHELRQIGRQVDDGVETLQDLHNIVKRFVLDMVKSRVMGWIVGLVATRAFWIRFVAKKGTETAFKQIKAKVIRS